MIETLRRPVAPRDCDMLGHMNVAAYVDAVSDAMFSVQIAVGLTPTDMATGRKISFVAARMEVDYRAELHLGDVFVLRSRVLHIGTKSCRFQHFMTRVEDGTLAFEAQNVAVLFDLTTRRALVMPEDLRARIEKLKEITDAA